MSSIIERRWMLAPGLYCAMTIITLSAGMQFATAQALIGAAAPAFTLTDSNGRNLSLADFKGKTVVLEWTSHECPYVGKHYRGNNMQALQKKWTGQGVVWLSVISSAPGQPGYVSPQEANKLTADRGAAPTAVLFARLQDLKSAKNFVDQALSEISQGKPVSVTASRAYGCSIKYGS